MRSLRQVHATRYVTPLREGGSLPGLVEADDDGLYVTKFRGAGQGPAALVAEVVGGELARALGLPVPELVTVELDPRLAAAEPDVEIQELVSASTGENLGLDYLPGALPFTPAALRALPAAVAAEIVWLDALLMNVDRTPRNPNLIVWHGQTWLIDHGAALFRQHGPAPLADSARAPFPYIAQHVVLGHAGPITVADERLAGRAQAAVQDVVAAVPGSWLATDPDGAGARRADIADYLHERLRTPREFVEEAEHARR